MDWNVLEYIFRHMMEPLGYLPWGILTGAVFLVLERLWSRAVIRKRQPMQPRRRLVLFLCVMYITVLGNLTYFSREPGSRIGMTIELFRTWGSTAMEHAFFIENIILFIPFGILFPLAFPPLRKLGACVLEGFLLSLFLEMMQFVTGRGYCQLDDIITNTLGTLIGWGCYRIWQHLSREKRDDKTDHTGI